MLIKTDYHNIFNTDIGTLDKIDPNIKHVLNFGKLKLSSFMSTHLDQQENQKIKLKREHVIYSANATLDFFPIKKMEVHFIVVFHAISLVES